MNSIKKMTVLFFITIFLAVSCEMLPTEEDNNPGGTGNPESSSSASADIIPDLNSELPTSASSRLTSARDVGDTAMFAYFGGKPDGSMEWHSFVMLNDVKSLGEMVASQMQLPGEEDPADPDAVDPAPADPENTDDGSEGSYRTDNDSEEAEPVSADLSNCYFMGKNYESLTIKISLETDPTQYYVMDGFSGDNQVLRYIAVPDDEGVIEKGYLVWANADEYNQNYSSDIHIKELVSVRFDLTDKDAKKLQVNTVHYHNQGNYYYGFLLRSTYNETEGSGTGQYTDKTQNQNFAIVYDLDTLVKKVAEFSLDGSSVLDVKEFGNDNQVTGNAVTMELSELGFTPLGVDDSPVPYFDTTGAVQAGNTITTVLSDWDAAVSISSIDF